MSKAAYWQRGETLDYKNTGGETIEANTIIVVGDRIGIAGMTINPGEVGSLHVTGVFEFEKDTSKEFKCGDEVHYDPASGKIVEAPDGDSSSSIAAGFAAADAAESDTKVIVKINA